MNYARPRNGWIKCIRQALCMTEKQLARRMGVSRSNVAQIESRELAERVSLKTMKKAAAALECEVVYFILPKDGKDFEYDEDK